MKNLLLAAFTAATVFTTAFATGENKISSLVLNNFRAEFKNATAVCWSSRTGFAKAAFILDNRQMEVFYDHKGDIIALSKNIVLDELPVNAKRAFARKYDGYTVKEAIRFDGINDQGYFIKAENDDHSVILKVDDAEQLSVFQRTKKTK